MNLKIIFLTTLTFFSCNLHNESGIIPELLMLKQIPLTTSNSESTTPLQLTYPNSSNAQTFNVGSTVSITPTITGTITSCIVNPTLPTGLTLDNTTCVISGTPINQSSATNYTITAFNSSESITAILNITITRWVQEAYLKAPNAEANDNFGYSVSSYGDTIVVGTPDESSNQTTITNGTTASTDNSTTESGAVYVFRRIDSNWMQEAYLKPPNPDMNDWFGIEVSISSDTIVVGASGENSNQTTITNGATASSNNSLNNAGAAYVFKRNGSTWVQEAYLKAPNSAANDSFGWSVSISTDTIVVGADSEDSNQTTITNGTTASADNSAAGSGAAYVFRRTGSIWTQEAYLKAPNSDISDNFGTSVSISNDTIVVGAPDESSNQTTITNGITASADNSASNAGAAYVFRRAGSTWAQEAYLKGANGHSGDKFGSRVSVDSDTIVVGTFLEDSNQATITNGTTGSIDNSASDSGAAYVFKRTGTNWVQEAYLKPSNVNDGDQFGYSVSISSDTIVFGAKAESSNQTTITNGTTASSDNSASAAGAVYVFRRY